MIRAGFLKKIASLAIISFSWLLAVQTGFLSGQEDPLRRARQLFQEGDYPKTLALLDEFISNNKGEAGQKKNVAEAYYLKAKVYHVAGEEEACDANLKLVFETYPEFTTNEPDIEFRERAGKIRSALFPAPKEKIEQKLGEEAKPGAMGTEAKKPKKFPWLLVGAAVIVAGIAAFLLFKKKSSSTTTTVPPSGGSVSVSSTPTGAKIYLDSVDTGKTTNATLSGVSSGDHTVKLIKEGYKDYEQNVTVTAGQTASVSATLTKNTVSVTSPSSGASWAKGTEYTIQWTIDASFNESSRISPAFPSIPTNFPQARRTVEKNLAITNVNIDLYKGGIKTLTIASNTANDFSEKWTVPASQATASDYKVRVSCSTDASVYGESGNFSISDVVAIIVSQFSSPGSSPTALEWDGNSLWMVDNLKKFYQLDTNGHVLGSFSFSKEVFDLAWDGSNLWAYTYSGLLKLDRSGNVLSTLNVYYYPGSGLAWDGTFFWVGNYNIGRIYKHDASGNQLLYFDVGNIDHPTGMAFNGTNLLIGDCFQLTNSIYIYTREGVQVSRIDLDPLGLTKITTFENKSVAWDGQFIWYSSTARFTIYKIKI